MKCKGLFIRGKFDLYKRHVSCIFQAFQSLILQILAQPVHRVQYWRDRINKQLGASARVLTDVIPGLSELIGQQTTVGKGSSNLVTSPHLPTTSLLNAAPAPLAPQDAQQRLERTFVAFVNIFAQVDHPLVIFIDDLQWADQSSLHLISLLHQQTDSHLLMIGAYRDNEVDDQHPLSATLHEIQRNAKQAYVQEADKLEELGDPDSRDDTASTSNPTSAAQQSQQAFKDGGRLSMIRLQPLSVSDIAHLVSDTFYRSYRSSLPFASLLHSRSGGNPFHLNQLLPEYFAKKALRYDYHAKQWQWDMQDLQKVQMPRDVVHLLCQQLAAMPLSAQQALQYGSVLGNTFSMGTLAAVTQQTPAQLAAKLWPCIEKGLLIAQGTLSLDFYIASHREDQQGKQAAPSTQAEVAAKTSETTVSDLQVDSVRPSSATAASSSSNKDHLGELVLKFAHDKIQAAAYSMVGESELAHIHLTIARLLHARMLEQSSAETGELVDIVSSFNAAADLITDVDEAELVVRLNGRAAEQAMVNAQFDTAKDLLVAARRLMPKIAPAEQLWSDRHYDMTYGIHHDLAKVATTLSEYQLVDEIVDEVLAHSKRPYDCASILEDRVTLSAVQNQLQRSIDAGLQALKLLDIDLDPVDKEWDLQRLQEQLDAAPFLEDPVCILATRINSALIAPIFGLAQVELFRQVATTNISLSLKFGLSGATAHGLSCFGIWRWENGQYSEAYRTARMGYLLVDRLPYPLKRAYTAKILQSYGVTMHHWGHPVATTLPILADGMAAGLTSGDVDYAAHSSWAYLKCMLW